MVERLRIELRTIPYQSTVITFLLSLNIIKMVEMEGTDPSSKLSSKLISTSLVYYLIFILQFTINKKL